MHVSPGSASLAVLDVPLVRLARRGDRHTVHELRVDVRMDSDAADPAAVVRAIHALAATVEDPEQLAAAVARHVAARSSAAAIDVEVRSRGWERLTIGGRERGGELTAPASVTRVAGARIAAGRERIWAGLRGLRLLSGTQEDGHALVEIELEALWSYAWEDVPYDTQWQQVRRALSEAYAERGGAAGGELARVLARAVLDEAPAVRQIEMRLTRLRHGALDMGAVGMDNNGTLFGAAEQHRVVHEVRMARDEVTEVVA